MAKFLYLYLFLIFVYISPLYNSIETQNNSTEKNETLSNDTYKSDEQVFYDDPFENLDFGNVIWLDDTNATSEIKKHELLYIVFYSPWCRYCHQFLPIYVSTSKYAAEQNLTIKFAKIDTSKSTNISHQFNIEGLPSVYLIYKGEKFFFEGERSKDGLLRLVNKKVNDNIYKFETLSQINDFIKSGSLALLSTLKNKELILYQSFLNYSKINQNIDFMVCTSDECLKEYKEDLILFKNYDEKINKYTELFGNIKDAKQDSLNEFIGTYAIECGAMLNNTQINMMLEFKRKMLFYFRNSSTDTQTKYDKVIKELGKELRDKKIYTVISDIKGEPVQENIASTFVILKQDLPTILLYLESPYSLRPAKEDQLNKEFIKDYIDKILDGKILKDLYSEPPLEDYNVDGLKYIIGRTYDKDVIEEKNNVLLTLIDGSYVGPDQLRVLDIMKNLTKKYTTKEKKIIFAFFDGSRNQPRDINLQQEDPPLVILYTNAMKEKKQIRMNHKNFTIITEEEVEDFLYEKLDWGKREQNVKTKDKKEENNKKQTDL